METIGRLGVFALTSFFGSATPAVAHTQNIYTAMGVQCVGLIKSLCVLRESRHRTMSWTLTVIPFAQMITSAAIVIMCSRPREQEVWTPMGHGRMRAADCLELLTESSFLSQYYTSW